MGNRKNGQWGQIQIHVRNKIHGEGGSLRILRFFRKPDINMDE